MFSVAVKFLALGLTLFVTGNSNDDDGVYGWNNDRLKLISVNGEEKVVKEYERIREFLD